MAKKAKKTKKSKTSKRKSIPSRVKEAVKKEVEKQTSYEITITKKVFGEAPKEYHFVLEDGRKLKNIYELLHELERMTDEGFRKYVNEFKNDFSSWLNDVFDMPDIAEEIRFIEDKMETQRRLMKNIIEEVKKAAINH